MAQGRRSSTARRTSSRTRARSRQRRSTGGTRRAVRSTRKSGARRSGVQTVRLEIVNAPAASQPVARPDGDGGFVVAPAALRPKRSKF